MNAWTVFAATTTVLLLKMHAAIVVQGVFRMKHRVFTKEEDARCWKGELAREDVPVVQRAQRVLFNDLENIPMFLFLAVGFIQLGGEAGHLAIYCGVFALARIAHTATYLAPRQPLRNRAFGVGLLTTLALATHTCLRAFG